MARIQQSTSGKRTEKLKLISRKEFNHMKEVMRNDGRFPQHKLQTDFRKQAKP